MPVRLNTAPNLRGFERRLPSPALAPYVQNIWWLSIDNWQQQTTQYLYADGGSGIIVNLAAPLRVNGVDVSQPALASGPVMHSTQLQFGRRVQLVGIRFQPGMGQPFFGVGLDELQFEDAVPGLSLALLAEQLSECADRNQQHRLIEQALLDRLQRSAFKPGPVHTLLSQISNAAGAVPLANLLAAVPLSQRQLERQFKWLVGVSPKQYSRIQRVGRARWQLKQSETVSLLDVAYSSGYFDQAHFIHDFKAVLGLTPGQYLNRIRLGR
ncbi:AraC family transcriptional regulator [Saccharospirillum mangrovi]|uniref:AraC family transcriptional regulator n=1 Tax=Saccharospirillum mangrovi TaxID=2161747 RepID=UPI000D38F367|nr:helix-turn-helix domain-containing protein [Saccharospirillum mangrovi]